MFLCLPSLSNSIPPKEGEHSPKEGEHSPKRGGKGEHSPKRGGKGEHSPKRGGKGEHYPKKGGKGKRDSIYFIFFRISMLVMLVAGDAGLKQTNKYITNQMSRYLIQLILFMTDVSITPINLFTIGQSLGSFKMFSISYLATIPFA